MRGVTRRGFDEDQLGGAFVVGGAVPLGLRQDPHGLGQGGPFAARFLLRSAIGIVLGERQLSFRFTSAIGPCFRADRGSAICSRSNFESLGFCEASAASSILVRSLTALRMMAIRSACG